MPFIEENVGENNVTKEKWRTLSRQICWLKSTFLYGSENNKQMDQVEAILDVSIEYEEVEKVMFSKKILRVW